MMAPIPRSAATKSRLDAPASGPLGPYDAPPSTMAAQLINNLSTTEEPSRPAEKNDLKRLMEEVLEQDANESDDVVSKLEQKHKLIYVFTRAVLERLSTDDPFMNQEQLVGQASDALDIFTVAVRELPGVLEYVLPAGVDLHSRGQEPLWTWLFPRVLMLLGRRNCEKLTEKIKDFFYISFQAAGGSPQHWNLTSFIFTYLRECVTSMYNFSPMTFYQNLPYSATLDRLQSSNILSHAQAVDIVLPSDDMSLFASFVVGNDVSPTSANDCTYVIRDATEGLSHARNVLSILVDVYMAAAASYDATPAFQDYVGWLLDSFLVSHELHKKWRANNSLHPSCSDACLFPFCSVHALVTSFQESLSPSLLRKGYTLLSTFCTDLLLDPTQLSERSIQLNLCSSIINLAAGCRRYDSVRRTVSLYLLPAIHANLASGNTFASGMGNNLKVDQPCSTSLASC
jgi:serine/threonine-protein kinase ATR